MQNTVVAGGLIGTVLGAFIVTALVDAMTPELAQGLYGVVGIFMFIFAIWAAILLLKHSK